MSEQTAASEFGIEELFRNILATRLFALVAVLLVSIAYWGLIALLNVAKPPVHSYSTRIELTFSGVDSGMYPNGTPFRRTDIIAPVVLERVYEQLGLEAYVTRKDFTDAFSAAPYTPARALILNKYANEAVGAEQAELDDRRERLGSELAAASRGNVQLTFTSARAHKIPEDLLIEVLRAVPREWNRHRVEDFGVVQFDRAMYTSATVNRELIESVDYLIAFEVILNRVRRLRENIDAIRAIPNASNVVDESTGQSLADLEAAVDDIEMYQIAPLMNPVRSLGIARDQAVVNLYFENVLTELNRSRDVLRSKLDNVKASYSDYVAHEREGELRVEQGTSGGTMIPQFGAEFIDRIVDMTNAGEDISYRQQLNTSQLSIANQVADREAEIARIEEVITTLNRKAARSDGEDETLRSRYTARINEELPAILQSLEAYFDVSNRLMALLSANRLGTDSLLYRIADGDVDHTVTGNILSMSNLRTYLILVFLTLAAVVPAVMIRNLLRPR